MSLLLIDSLIPDISGIIQGLIPGTDYLVFDWYADTYNTLRDKIPTSQYECIGIAQHNTESCVFPFLACETHPILCSNVVEAQTTTTGLSDIAESVISFENADGIEIADPELNSWQAFIQFLQWLNVERGMQHLDLLLCNVWSNPNWVYAINRIRNANPFNIRASLNITGAGGDFILESDNVDMVGIYFTTAILNYQYAFAFTYLFEFAYAGVNPGSGNPLSITDNGYVYSVGFSRFSKSTDYGKTWTFNTTLFSGYGYVAACSANGQIVVIGYNVGGQFKYSTDYGENFTTVFLPSAYSAVIVQRAFVHPTGSQVLIGANNDILMATPAGNTLSFSVFAANMSPKFNVSKNGNVVFFPNASGSALYRYNFNTWATTQMSGIGSPLSTTLAEINGDGTTYYVLTGAQQSYVQIDRYSVSTTLTLQNSKRFNDSWASFFGAASSSDGQVVVLGGGTTGANYNRFWYSTDSGATINVVITTSTNGIGAVAVSPNGLRFIAATNSSSIYIYTRFVVGTAPTIISGTGKYTGFTLDYTPSLGGYPLLTTYAYSTDGGSTFANLASGPPSVITLPSPMTYSFVVRAISTGNLTGAGSWTADSAVYTVNVPCFLEGTLILRYNEHTQREEYVRVETLQRGDLIKTARNGYKAIHCVGSRDMYNPPLSVKTENRIYCYKMGTKECDGLFADLYVTGNHCALLYDVEEETLEKVRLHMGDIYVSEGYYRVPACLDGRCAPIVKESMMTIWHFALEHESRYKNYGVYANGLLVESSSIRYMEELAGMELK